MPFSIAMSNIVKLPEGSYSGECNPATSGLSEAGRVGSRAKSGRAKWDGNARGAAMAAMEKTRFPWFPSPSYQFFHVFPLQNDPVQCMASEILERHRSVFFVRFLTLQHEHLRIFGKFGWTQGHYLSIHGCRE